MKKLSWNLTRGAVWVAAGLIVGAGIGTGVGFLVVGLNKNSDNNKPSETIAKNDVDLNGVVINLSEQDSGVQARESIFGNKNETIKVDGQDESVVFLGLETLAYKLRTRLGLGPEVAQLKGITITPDGSWAEANGVYLGGTGQIFINSKNIIEEYNRTVKSIGNFENKEQEIEYIAEFVFQIIAHEYNHHMAYTYINARFNDASNRFFTENPVYVDSKSVNNNGAIISTPNDEAWDRDFYVNFTKALNYDSLKSNGTPNGPVDEVKNKMYLDQMADSISYNDKKGGPQVQPISKYFTASDIYKFANFASAGNVIKHDNGANITYWNDRQTYAFFNKKTESDNVQPSNMLDQKTLMYQYSLAELYARKVQQMVMPIALNYEDIKDANGKVVLTYPLPRYRATVLSDPDSTLASNHQVSAEDELFGADQLMWRPVGNGTRLGTYSPFILDTKNYSNGTVFANQSNAWRLESSFTSDYLYQPDVNGVDNSNAFTIFDSILNEMGYSGKHVYAYNAQDNKFESSNTEQSDISSIWWQNNSTVDKNGQMRWPGQTNKFNMGGYVNEKYTQIGYIDQNGTFVRLSNILTSPFTYGVKDTLISSERNTTIKQGKDQYFWTMDGYQDINNFVGHDLVFYSPEIDDNIKHGLELAEPIIAQELTNWNADPLNISNQKTLDEIKNMYLAKLNKLFIPGLTSYNTDASTWLSLDSATGSTNDPWPNKTGINNHIAKPTYDSTTWGIRLEVLDN